MCIFDTDFLFDLFDSIFIDLYLRFEYYDKLTELFDFVFVKFEQFILFNYPVCDRCELVSAVLHVYRGFKIFIYLVFYK